MVQDFVLGEKIQRAVIFSHTVGSGGTTSFIPWFHPSSYLYWQIAQVARSHFIVEHHHVCSLQSGPLALAFWDITTNHGQQSLEMDHHMTLAYCLQANGLVERLHQTLKAARHTCNQTPCSDKLPWVFLSLWTTLKLDLGYSPVNLSLFAGLSVSPFVSSPSSGFNFPSPFAPWFSWLSVSTQRCWIIILHFPPYLVLF